MLRPDRSSHIAWVCSHVVVGIGLFVLAGWLFDLPFIVGAHVGTSMSPGVAATVVAAGFSLHAWLRQPRSFVGRGLGVAVAVAAAAALVEAVCFGARDVDVVPETTAVVLLMLGVALAMFEEEIGSARVAEVFGLLAYTATLVAGLDLFLGALTADELVPSFRQTAVATVVCSLCLSVGLFAARPDRGWTKVLVGRSASALANRRLLITLTPVVLLVSVLRFLGQQRGFYDARYGVALMAGLTMLLVIASTWSTLRALSAVEERVRKAKESAEATSRELETFSYSVSHDLRAPLRSIDGFSAAVLEDCADRIPVESVEDLQRVRAAAQRMSVLIDALLALSRVNRQEVVREEVDVTALATTVVDGLRRSYPDRSVETSVAPGMTTRGDPRLLSVAFDNLIGNAWKFTAKSAAPRIEIGMIVAEPGHFFVKDNGAGFDMAYVDKLFGAFQRLHAATEFEGTGIGLATVQRIALRHGGRAWAEGSVGKGATFHIVVAEAG